MPEQVAGMQKPVLVRVRDTPVNRAEFARQANAPTVAMMSPAEQARADAARMDSMDGLEPDESGDFSGAASRGFVRRFMARLPVSEQAAMVDADGRLSSAGYARVRNAVLAKAWGTGEGGSDALARMTESLDDNTRSISRALMMAAPETARMREAIAAGARHDADIAGDVAAAAQEISRLREAGQSVQQALAQTDAFGDKHTPEARALMQFMADNARRPRRIAQLIQAYWQALDAAGDPHQQGMFGGQAAPTKQALLQAAMRQVQDAPAQGAAQEREAQEREAQDRAQAAWNALPPEGRHQLALAAGVQGVVARNAARHADWSGLPAAMQQRLAQAVGAASAAPGRDNAGHETAHESTHESGVPRGLAARETADSRRLEQRINDWRRRSAMPAGMRFGHIPSQALPDALRHALDGFADATGTRVVLVRNFTPEIDDFNGVNFGDGVIYINETSQYPITLTAAHEWLHNLRKTHPALYGQLAAEVQRQGRLPEYQQRLKRDGEPRWEQADVVQEELTAAAVGDAMTDPQFLARLAEKDGGLFARVAKSFLAFLDTLTARWRSQGSNAYLRDVQAFRDKLAAVLQAYEQQAGQAGKMGQAGLPQAMFQRVWHGTPHKGIEKTGFRLDKIGTGEGLQVYGHGIYFASRREVAEFYRGMRQGQVHLDGRLMTDGHHRGAASTGDPEVDALLLDAQGDVDKAIAWARDFGQDAQAAKLERLRGRVQRGEPGQLYAAEIPEDDDLLDWDKPLDEQPAKVRRALLELAGGLPADGRAAFRQAMARRATGQDVYAFLARRSAGADASAEGAQKGQRAASELLLEHGIPGLRYLDGDSRNAGEGSHNYVIWDEGLLTPEAAQIAPQYSRKQATKAAYERRIDELFAGGHASRQGAVLLDGSDVMGLLGHEHVPLVLNERHLLDGRSSHPEMTAAAWKRVPEWLESPAAVYDDPRHPGRLTVIAPETLAGYPVVMAVELEPDRIAGGHEGPTQLLVTAFAKTTGDLPALGFLAASGRLQYVDTKTAPVAWPDTGDIPRASGRAHGAKRILTEKSLAAWRKAQAAKAGDAPAFSLPESRASRQVKREASALKVQQAQRLVKALSRGWANAPEVVIASSVRDEALPETARRAIAKQESRGAGGRVEGFYWQGKVYLVAGNLPSMHDVARVYMHETLGHYGLRGVYGEKLNSILNRTGMAMRGEVIERARQYGFHGLGAAAKTASDAQVWDSMTDKQKLDSAEEALAYLAQTGGKVGDEKSLGLLRELVAAIRSWLRAHVPVFANLRYSDDEIMREFILPARRWVKNGSGQADDAGDVMFQLAWHGTPYRGIEKTGFKLNKIGTGEGAQAYGWGIYFASQRHVAEEYRRNLTRDTPQARYEMLGKHKDMLDRQIRQGGSYLRYDEQGRLIAQGLALKDGADMKGVVIQPYSKWKLAKLKKQAAELEAQMNELRTLLGPGGSTAGGQLYQTDVPEDKDLLIWDSPWNKQPLKVRRAVVNFLRQVSNGPVRPTQSDIPRIHAADALKHRIQNRKRSDALTGKDLYTAFRDIFGGPKAASEALRAAGVPGLRYLDGMSRAGGEGTYNYVIWDEALLTPEAAQIAPQYSRKQATKAAYDKRIDALFAGGKAQRVGQRVLDRSDVLGLLGHENKPVLLQESKVLQGQLNHPRMTAHVWKQVPEWLENPAAVFESDTEAGRLVVIAPETLGGAPVSIIVEPQPTAGGEKLYASLLVNAYDRPGQTPFMRWIGDGLLRYVDKKKFPAVFALSVGRRLPDTALQNKPGTVRILTEKNLAGWRKLHAGQAQPDARFSRKFTDDDFRRAEASGVAAAQEADGVLSPSSRDELQGRFWDEANEYGTIDGDPVSTQGLQTVDEDGEPDYEYQNSPEWRKRVHEAVDAAVSRHLPAPFASFEDIDAHGTASQAFEAARAALDELGVPYSSRGSGTGDYTGYIFVRRHDFDESRVGEAQADGRLEEDVSLKLRFADHGNQSVRHSEANYNWFGRRGSDKMSEPLRNMVEDAVAFYQGDERIAGGVHFSRRAPEPLEPPPDEAARLRQSALEQLDRVFNHPGTVSWWHKTVGTMRNLAERQPLFKPVYEAAQQFIDDVSHFANDAADFAPRLLPRLESWRDLGKRALSAADSQAVAAPLFEGTLSYTRGKDGSLAQTDNVDAAGVVFTDAELKGRFGLTPAQIDLYRQARAAIDRSIDTTARADILRLAGRDFAHLRQAVMDAPDLRAAAVQVVEAMQEVMQGDAKRRDAMRKAIEAAQERVQTAQALMQRGYAPLTRFGRYTLDVVDAQGQRQYFGLYESRREANVAAIHMRSQYPGAQVTQGTLSDDAYKLFAGITPESLELFGDLLAAPGQGKDKGQEQAFQAWLQLARNNRSAIKRLIHRKGVAGYSQDAGRVLASFIYANARQTAGALNAGRMDRAIAAIPKEQGQLRDVAMALRDYTQNPREEGQAIRGMLFAQYLGGSLASAAVNMTQPFAVTLPWLSQFGGMRQAAAQMTRALADMTRPGHRYEADLARDMAKAEEDGVVSPQEIHQLMAQARGAGALRSGDGTRRGDALAAAANAWERLKVAWGQPFALAEQFNRRCTYIAAWRLARQQGMADADAFARRAVLETQFSYTRANKPRWGRGAVGGALFTFKTYSVSYLELMHRMWTQGGTPGKQGVAWMLAMLLLMGGAGGLPFMEDAEDLVDGLAQLAGYNTSAKQWRQQALQDIVGDGLAEFIESGVSGLPGAPIDISGRLGMGNLLPGTGLLLTKQNRERDLLDVAGPAGDLLARGFAAGRKLLTGDAGGAAMELAPTAARNLAKGADMLATGSYRDAKGYKVLDTTALEALAKAAGFQPRSVAQVQEGNSFLMRSKSFYQHTSAEIKAQWARALFEKDEAALQRVRQRVADWNRHNPKQPITVRMPDIWRRVREMGKERSQRIADSAPRALRQQMRQALAQEG